MQAPAAENAMAMLRSSCMPWHEPDEVTHYDEGQVISYGQLDYEYKEG